MDERLPPERDPILLAAAELFERFGPARASIDAIAIRCGFAPEVVRERFPTPGHLLDAMIRRFNETFPECLALVGPACWNGSGEHGGHDLADRVLGRVPPCPAENEPEPAGPRRSRLGEAVDLCLERLGPIARVALRTDELSWLRHAVQRVRVITGETAEAPGTLLPPGLRTRRRTPTPERMRAIAPKATRPKADRVDECAAVPLRPVPKP